MHQKLREIRALCKAVMVVSGNAARAHLMHEMRDRLQLLFVMEALEWDGVAADSAATETEPAGEGG